MEENLVLEKICSHNEVKDAQLKIQNGRLTALIVPMDYHEEKNIMLQQSIKKFLASSIPYSQFPSDFIFCKELQVGPEEKTETQREVFSSEDRVIQSLNDMWCQALEINKTDNENSFISLGGDSIKAMAVIMEVEKVFGIDISFQEFFKFSNFIEFRDFVLKNLPSV